MIERPRLSSHITAGLPGLLPEVRNRTTVQQYTRAFSNEALLTELEQFRETVAGDGGIDSTNPDAQTGRTMTTPEMIRRLKWANSNLIFEVSTADKTKMGIYLVQSNSSRRFICGMENGWMPEFTIRHCEEVQVPDPDIEGHWSKERKFVRETRGWRTVLARLLRERLITEAQIESGWQVSRGRSSSNWQLATTT